MFTARCDLGLYIVLNGLVNVSPDSAARAVSAVAVGQE